MPHPTRRPNNEPRVIALAVAAQPTLALGKVFWLTAAASILLLCGLA
jgi:hypothetical protein